MDMSSASPVCRLIVFLQTGFGNFLFAQFQHAFRNIDAYDLFRR